MFKEADSQGCLVNTMPWNFLRSCVRESRRSKGHPSLSPVPLLRRPGGHCLLRLKTDDPRPLPPPALPTPQVCPRSAQLLSWRTLQRIKFLGPEGDPLWPHTPNFPPKPGPLPGVRGAGLPKIPVLCGRTGQAVFASAQRFTGPTWRAGRKDGWTYPSS